MEAGVWSHANLPTAFFAWRIGLELKSQGEPAIDHKHKSYADKLVGRLEIS